MENTATLRKVLAGETAFSGTSETQRLVEMVDDKLTGDDGVTR